MELLQTWCKKKFTTDAKKKFRIDPYLTQAQELLLLIDEFGISWSKSAKILNLTNTKAKQILHSEQLKSGAARRAK